MPLSSKGFDKRRESFDLVNPELAAIADSIEHQTKGRLKPHVSFLNSDDAMLLLPGDISTDPYSCSEAEIARTPFLIRLGLEGTKPFILVEGYGKRYECFAKTPERPLTWNHLVHLAAADVGLVPGIKHYHPSLVQVESHVYLFIEAMDSQLTRL